MSPAWSGAVRALAFIPFFFVLLAPCSLEAADWPLWRGRNWDGVSPEQNLPETWSPDGENLLWKKEVGGRSTPIVLDGRVCLMTLAEPENPSRWQNRIACFDAETGDLVWDYRYKVFQTDIPHHRVGWASLAGDAATGNIYALGIEGMLHCFDREGNVVWKRSFEEEAGRISGYGGRTVTPIVDGDLVYVNFLNAGWGENFIPRDRFYALNKNTGKTVWISTPGKAPLDTTYTVPVVRIINGERLLISGNADGSIYALQARTGEKVWGFPLSKRGINSSVVVDGDLVYASHSEENVDGSTLMGRLVCLDASQVTDGKPKLVWKVDGFAAGYATPAIHDGRLYHIDNSANLAAFNAKTGERLWTYNLGIAQRSSPVVADGKIYVSDLDGKFYILKLNGDEKPELIDKETFYQENGALAQINGSPSVANGRVYMLTRTDLYCIGEDRPPAGTAAESGPPPPTPAPGGAQPAHLQVVPAEIVLKPGAEREFAVRAFDEKGRLIGTVEAEWSLEGVPGEVASGRLAVAEDNAPRAGRVIAKADGLEGAARIAVRPLIPFEQNFDELEEGAVPEGWPGAQGRFEAAELNGEKVFKKLSANPRSWRTTVYIGHPHESGYVIEADLYGEEKTRRLPDMGLVSHRYTMALMGNRQKLQIRTWLSELEHFSKTIDFSWDPDVWYRMKLLVGPPQQDGSGTVRGKVWKRGEPEPEEWTIEVVDPIVHEHGSPGIYGYSSAPVYYDNVEVTPASE